MVLTILQGNSRSIAQKIGEICTGQADLQPIPFKSDRLLAIAWWPDHSVNPPALDQCSECSHTARQSGEIPKSPAKRQTPDIRSHCGFS